MSSWSGVCRDFFIRNLHDALSGHSSRSVEEAIAFSEQSKTKCIGITIETRPDYCLKPHLSSMLQVLPLPLLLSRVVPPSLSVLWSCAFFSRMSLFSFAALHCLLVPPFTAYSGDAFDVAVCVRAVWLHAH